MDRKQRKASAAPAANQAKRPRRETSALKQVVNNVDKKSPAKKAAQTPKATKSKVAATKSKSVADRKRAPEESTDVPEVKKAKKLTEAKEEIIPKAQFLQSRHGRGAGILLACGQNDCGQLGMPQNVEQRKRPQKVPGLGEVVALAAGGLHSVVLTAKGEVYTFGNNDEGALGRHTEEEEDRFEATKVPLPGRVYMISAGDAHSAALLEDGTVFVWGIFKSSSGDFGLVPGIIGKTPKPTQIMPSIHFTKIASGENHMALLSETGQVYTFGCPEQGQLGRFGERLTVIGSSRTGNDKYLTPTPISGVLTKGKAALFDDVWAGGMATYLKVKESGKVYVCGLNNYHQIAPANKGDSVIKFTPEVHGSLPEGVVAVAGGQHHSLVLANGKVHSFGSTTYGRLGTGDLGPDKPVQSEPSHVDLPEDCIDIACGTAVSYAITKSGDSYSWGMGTNGQLGTGSEDDEFEPFHIKSKETEDKRVIAVSAGGQHALFIVAEKNHKAPPTLDSPHPALTSQSSVSSGALGSQSSVDDSLLAPSDQEPDDVFRSPL